MGNGEILGSLFLNIDCKKLATLPVEGERCIHAANCDAKS